MRRSEGFTPEWYQHNETKRSCKVLTIEYIRSVRELCKRCDVKLHMDGAPLMHAATYLNVEPAKLVESCDSISMCLSKALAAPVGSLVVGTFDFIRRAKRLRGVLGGEMRQAGVLAAAGIVALTEMPKLLSVDSEKDVQTNIVLVVLNAKKVKIDGKTFCNILRQDYGILASAPAARRCRFITHYMIIRDNIQHLVERVEEVIEKNKFESTRSSSVM